MRAASWTPNPAKSCPLSSASASWTPMRALGVTRGAEVTNRGERRIELDDGNLPLAGAHCRLGQQLLRLRRFVRRARVAPQVDRRARCDQRVGGGAGSEANTGAAVVRARLEEDRLVDAGNVGQSS